MSNEEVSKLLHVAMESLRRCGFLLNQDLRFPNLVSIIAGRPVHGSWWGHPKAKLIFQVAGRLAIDSDVLLTKLVSGKETYVHRNQWPDFLALATSKDSWQFDGLTNFAHFLLNSVESRGELKTHEFAREAHVDVKSLGVAARDLERRLLVYGDDIHTPRGFHAKLLRSWKRWMIVGGFRLTGVNAQEAMRSLDTRVEVMNTEFGAKGTLPWKKYSPKN